MPSPRPRRSIAPGMVVAAACSVAASAAGPCLAAGAALRSSLDAGLVLDASPTRFTFDPAASDLMLGALAESVTRQDAAGPDAAGEASDASVASWSMDGDAEDESLAIPQVDPRYGEAGSVRLDLRGGYGTDVKDGDQWIGWGSLGLTGFIEDGLAIRGELNAAQISQLEGSEQGIGFSLLFEWHFIQRATWSVYLDGGAGVLFTTDDVPATGSNFNFTPQAGLGFTADLHDEMRLVLGVKWHHISNANTFSQNPGRDHVMVYGGLSLPF
ncbi:MAG: acyloxyacyl hydrolase [Planctomycetota bacterium]